MDRTRACRFYLAERKEPPTATNGNAKAFSYESLGWKCPPAASLCLEGPAAGMCKYWAGTVCQIAEQHVRGAFDIDEAWFTKRSVPVVLALAGSDAEDHEATMRLAKELISENIPNASTALMDPGDLRSGLSYANRKIIEKLKKEESEPAADLPEEDEELNDDVPTFSFPSQQGNESRPAVLLFQGVDAAPKDVLRQVLSFWHASCAENNVPLLIFLGLKHLPPSRQSLFDLEDDEQLPFVHVQTLHLFDSSKVCEQLINRLIEDYSCPLALSPEILKRLREIFKLQQQSVSHLLRALFLIFDEALCQTELAEPVAAFNAMHLSARREVEGSKIEEALSWRSTLVKSLPIFEALMAGAWDTAKYYEKLQKIYQFLEAIWPVPACKEAKQHEMLGAVFANLLNTLCDVPVKQVRSLLTDLQRMASSGGIPEALQPELARLLKQAEDFDEGRARGDLRRQREQLRKSLRRWVEKLQAAYWQPLVGDARDVFLKSLNCSKDSLDAAEKHLTSKFEGKLQHLALAESAPLADTASVFQLLECCTGRQLKAADVWLTFSQLKDSEKYSENFEKDKEVKEVKLRFQNALMTLYHLGLITPSAGCAQKGLSGWRLRKRVFGRVWLEHKSSEGKQDAREPSPSTPNTTGPQQAADTPSPARGKTRKTKAERAETGSTTSAKPMPEPGNKSLKSLPFGRIYGAEDAQDGLRRPEKKRKGERIFFG